MNQVKLSVGGRDYKVACAPGEEDHVGELGRMIDARLKSLGSNLSPRESQNLLFGALLLADELHETKKIGDMAVADGERNRAQLKAQSQKLEEALRQMEAFRAQNDALSQKTSDTSGWDSERDDLREQISDALKEAKALAARVAVLQQERDALSNTLAIKDRLLTKADAHMDELKGRLADIPAHNGADRSVSDDPALALALERFGDLLENCADKLENTRPAS